MLKSSVNTMKIAVGFASFVKILISLILVSIYCRTVVLNDRLRWLGDPADVHPFRPVALRPCLSTGLPFLRRGFLFWQRSSFFSLGVTLSLPSPLFCKSYDEYLFSTPPPSFAIDLIMISLVVKIIGVAPHSLITFNLWSHSTITVYDIDLTWHFLDRLPNLHLPYSRFILCNADETHLRQFLHNRLRGLQ